MNAKQIVWTFITFLAVAAFAIFFFMPGRVDAPPVTPQELSRAVEILRDSLPSPNYTYLNFLEDNQNARLTTDINIYSDGEETENGRRFYINAPNEGLYFFSLEYDIESVLFSDIIISLLINGETQHERALTIILPSFWKDESKDFPLNRFGDEIAPNQITVNGPHTVYLFDAGYTTDAPLLFELKAGENVLEITNETSADLTLGRLNAFGATDLPAYREPSNLSQRLLEINPIFYSKKNSPFVSLGSTRAQGVLPNHPVDRRINTLNMPDPGAEAFFDIHVPESGFYEIALNAYLPNLDIATFVSVRVNDETQFAEALSIPLIPKGDRIDNYILPYSFYLEAGDNEISLRAEIAPFIEEIDLLRLIISHANWFGLEIRRITGREIDRNRTWRLTNFLPDTDAYLWAYEIIYRSMVNSLSEYSPRSSNSRVATNMTTALALLKRMREFPDELPLRIELLNGENASVLQMAGNSLDELVNSNITINNIFFGDSNALPRPRADWITQQIADLRLLWATFYSDKFRPERDPEALNIWVNYSYLHVDILQRMADASFTPQTGIAVNLRVMPDVNRLIMARAAGTNPDAALGVPAYMPFEMSARGALYDFTNFPDFWEYMGDFTPGTIVSYIFNEGVYAAPETVNFAATVYRTDILGGLGLEVPDTWEEVGLLQAHLRRFDASFYKPIASGVGYKWFFQTSPMIYQHGGLLYREDGLGTAINEPNAVRGITALGDLFTTYALSEQVPSFFNSFRFGQTPIGIMDSGMYMQLTRAAPELLGQWAMAPFPGTLQEDGEISRWFIANGAGSIIFENSPRPDEAWSFIKWFLSEETASNFAFTLFSNHNILWLSSNQNALARSPIQYSDLRIILDSMRWLRDPPRSPGQYLLERGLSDVWNTIVFDGTPPQVAIDMATIEINREFTRRMTEFGFIDQNGAVLRPYAVREIDWVIDQIESARP